MPKVKKKSKSKQKRNQTDAVLLRLSPEDHELFREAAAKDERSLSNWIRHVLRKAAKGKEA